MTIWDEPAYDLIIERHNSLGRLFLALGAIFFLLIAGTIFNHTMPGPYMSWWCAFKSCEIFVLFAISVFGLVVCLYNFIERS